MNILITGAGGQLGRSMRDVSEGYDHKCFFADLAGGCDVMSLDVTDASAVAEVMDRCDIDVIINCAGYTDVNRAESDEDNAFIVNALAPKVLADAAKASDVVLIHVSTDYVYDGRANVPYRETDAVNPQSAYARTKAAGDRAVAESGCRYIILRTAWLYSCYGRNFFRTIEEKAADSPSVSVVMDQVGTPTYAADLAQAVFSIIDGDMLDRTGVYHYSNEGVCSWYDFAKAINRGLGYLCDVRPCRTSDYPSKVCRPSYSVMDKSLFKRTFGLEIPHWEDSLLMCINEFQNINK